MNQVKIGKFIAECRKNKNMTQIELAEKLGVTDKAIGNWENGRNMPDISLFEPLCTELEITVNDLIQGEKLTEEDKVKNSEKNIISMVITKKELENLQILVEILILASIIITGILTKIIAINIMQRITTIIFGIFILGFGIFLRIKLRKIKNEII